MSVEMMIVCESASEARREMLVLLGLESPCSACTEPHIIASSDVPPDQVSVIETDPPVAVAETPAKGKRGRPAKKAADPVVEPTADEPPVEPSNVVDGVEYEDVKEDVKRTAADLRAACVAAVDRVEYDVVAKFLSDNYGTTVAAEVPADKLNEAYDKVSALGVSKGAF
jgi:hypothetical protein